MIPSTRHGYARALSNGLLASSLPTTTHIPSNPFATSSHAVIPHAESSAQAIQRSIALQRAQRSSAFAQQQRAFSSSAGGTGSKGKGVDVGITADGVGWSGRRQRGYATAVAVRMEEEEKVGEEVWDKSLPLRAAKLDGHQAARRVDVRVQDWPDEPGFPFHRRRIVQHVPPTTAEGLGTVPGELAGLHGADGATGTIRAPVTELNPLQPFPSTTAGDLDTSRRRFQTRFDKLVKAQPVLAFLSLHSLDQECWECLEAEHVDRIMRSMLAVHAHQKLLFGRMDLRHVDKILRKIRTHLLSLAPRSTDRAEYTPGTRFRGRRLADFLSVCVLLRRETMAKGNFVRYFVPQIVNSQCSPIDLERYISFLQNHGQWQLIVDSLAHDIYPSHKANLPTRHWSAKVFQSVADAYLRLGIPASAIRLGDEYQAAGGDMTIGCFTCLLQAQVALGNHAAAKKLRKLAKETCGPSKELEFEEKVAILRGQRRMGFDRDLEEAIVEDLVRYTNAQAGRLVHALIKLRLGNGDTFGALALLDRFDLDIPDGAVARGRKLAPVKGTIALAFEIIGRRPNLDQLRPWWGYFLANPTKIEDQTVATVVQVLAAVGMIDEAFEMIRSHLNHLEPASRMWRLPPGVEVGMRTVNALTECMARRKGLDGLKAATDLMRQADIRADGNTLQVILDAVRQNMVAHPNDLAEMLQAMLDRASNVKAQIGHIDSILAEAVNLASQHRRTVLLSRDTVRSTGHLRDPAAGLLPLERFAKTIEGILNSLRARAVQSSSHSLASRLRFEALVGSHNGRIPAAQAICNEVTDLGYKLDARHLMALMRGYVDAGEMDQAERVVELGSRHGVKTTRGMLMILLRGHIRYHARRRASKVYERIRVLNLDSPTGGSDALAVTAATEMIRAHCTSRHYNQAARLVRRDLLRESVVLDDRAILVGMTALRWVGQEISSLDLLDKRNSPTLNFHLRSAVRSLHLHLQRKLDQKRATKEERLALLRAEDVLEKDVRSRPYIAEGSLFRRKDNDRVPRWYNADAAGRPKLRQGSGAQFVTMIAPRDGDVNVTDGSGMGMGNLERQGTQGPIDELDDKAVIGIKAKVERRRMQLERELVRRHERSEGENSERRGLRADQKRMVEDEVRLYEADLVQEAREAVSSKKDRAGDAKLEGRKLAGRKRRPTTMRLPRSEFRGGVYRKRNPKGAMETRVRTEWAKKRRESRTVRPAPQFGLAGGGVERRTGEKLNGPAHKQ